MALIQLNKNGGLRLNGRKAKRASRKSLAAAAGAVGVPTTRNVQKTVEQKLTKNELIAALRSKSSGTWTKKHGGGRKPMSMEEKIGRHLNKVRARKAAASVRKNYRMAASAARRATKLAAHKKAVAARRNARKMASAVRRATKLAAHKKAVAARAAARKEASQAKKNAAAKERMLERASVMFARNQAKKNAAAALANKRAERLVKLQASMTKLLNKKRTWSNSEVANLRLKLAKAKKAANVTAIRKEAAKYKKKYVRKAKEVAKPKAKKGSYIQGRLS